MPTITFNVNGAPITIDAENDDELLYLLRDRVGVFGPKYGCGVGVCGACTIFQDAEAVRPCIVPMADVEGSDLTTIEGLAVDDVLHPVQRAWIDEDVAQCGYCQAGQIMTAVKLLEATPDPDDDDIDNAMSENVCRCGTYYRIRKAIKRAAGITRTDGMRLAGSTRIGTAIRISADLYADGAAAAVALARADNFPDALAAAPFATAIGGPLLLTNSDTLDADALAEIGRVLEPGGTVHILGGEVAINSSVQTAIGDAGFAVERIGGANRQETAALIAQAITDTPTGIFIATGEDFPDALLAGAAAARTGGVVLLANEAGLDASSQAMIDGNPDVDVFIIGQPAAGMVGDIGEVVAGPDQFETSVAVAERFDSGVVGVGLASGLRFPDALVGAVHAAANDLAVLLVDERSVPTAVADYIADTPGLNSLSVYGGIGAIADNILLDIVTIWDAR